MESAAKIFLQFADKAQVFYKDLDRQLATTFGNQYMRTQLPIVFQVNGT